MDVKKKEAVLACVRCISKKEIKSLLQLKDGDIFMHMLGMLNQQTPTFSADSNSSCGKLLLLKEFFKTYYDNDPKLDDILKFDLLLGGTLTEELQELELAKIAVVLIGVGLLDKNADKFTSMAGEVPSELHQDVVAIIQSVLPAGIAECSLTQNIHDVLAESSSLEKAVNAASEPERFPSPPVHSIMRDFPHDHSLTSTPIDPRITRNLASARDSPLRLNNSVFNNLSIRDITSPLRGMSLSASMSSSPLARYVLSPELIQKAVLKQKQLELQKVQRLLSEERLLRDDANADLAEKTEKNVELTQQLKQLEERVQSLRYLKDNFDEHVDLKSRLQEVEQENDRLKSEMTKLKAVKDENMMMQKESSQHCNDVASLYKEIRKLENSVKEKADLEKKLEKLDVINEELRFELKTSEEKLSMHSSEKEALVANLEIEKGKKNQAKQELEDYIAQQNSGGGETMGVIVDLKLSEVTHERDELYIKLEELNKKYNELKEMFDTSKTEYESKIEQTDQSIRDLTDDLKKASDEYVALQKERDENVESLSIELKNKTSEHREVLEEKDKDIKSLEAQLMNAKESHNKSEVEKDQNIKDLENKIETLTTEHAEVVEEKDQAIFGLRNKLETSNLENTKVVDDFSAKLKMLTQEKEENEENIKALTVKLNENIVHHRQVIEDKDLKNKDLEVKLSEVNAELVSICDEKALCVNELTAKVQEMSTENCNIRLEKDKEIEMLQIKVNALIKENELNTEQFTSNIKETSDHHQKQTEELNRHLTELNVKYEESLNEVSRTREEKDQCILELKDQLEKSLSEYNQNVEIKDGIIRDVNANLDKVSAEYASMKTDNQKEIEDLKGKLASITLELTQVVEQSTQDKKKLNADFESTCRDSAENIRVKDLAIDKLQVELEEKSKQISILKEESEQRAQDKIKLQADLEASCKDFAEQIEVKDQAFSKVQAELEDALTQVSSVKEERDNAVKNLTAELDESSDKQNQLIELKEDQIEKLKIELELIKAEQSQTKEEQDQCILKLQDQIKISEVDREQSDEQKNLLIDKLTGKLETLSADCELMKSKDHQEIEELKVKVEQITQDKETFKADMEISTKNFLQQIKEKQEALKEAQDELKQFMDEHDIFKEEKSKDIEKLKVDLEENQNLLQQSTEEKDQIIKALRNENNDIKNKQALKDQALQNLSNINELNTILEAKESEHAELIKNQNASIEIKNNHLAEEKQLNDELKLKLESAFVEQSEMKEKLEKLKCLTAEQVKQMSNKDRTIEESQKMTKELKDDILATSNRFLEIISEKDKEIENLSRQLKDITSEKSKLLTEKETTASQMLNLEMKVEEITKENYSAMTEKSRSEEELREQLAKLTAEDIEAKKETATLNCQIKSTSDKVITLSREKEDVLKELNAKLVKANDDHFKKVEELQSELRGKITVIGDLANKNVEDTHIIRKNEETIKELTCKLEASTTNYTQQFGDMQKLIAEKTAGLETAQYELENVKKEKLEMLEELTSKFETARESELLERSSLQVQITEIKSQHQAELLNLEDENQKLVESLKEDGQKQISALKVELQETKASYSTSQQSVEELQRELDNLIAAHSEEMVQINAQNAQYQEKLAEQASEHQELEQQTNQLSEEIELLKAKNEQLESKSISLFNENINLGERESCQLMEHDKQMKNLHKQLEKLQKELETATKELQKKRKECGTMKENFDHLTYAVNIERDTNEKFQKLNKLQTSKQEEYKLRIANLEKENKETISELEKSRTTVDYLNRKIHDLWHQLHIAGMTQLGDSSHFNQMIGKEPEISPPETSRSSNQSYRLRWSRSKASLADDSLNSSANETTLTGDNVLLRRESIASFSDVPNRVMTRGRTPSDRMRIASTSSAKSLGGVKEPEPFQWDDRLSELQRRNTLYPAHLKSSYPVEIQTVKQEKMSDDSLRLSLMPDRKIKSIKAEVESMSHKRKVQEPESNSDSPSKLKKVDSNNTPPTATVFYPLARNGPSYHRPGPPTPRREAHRGYGRFRPGQATPPHIALTKQRLAGSPITRNKSTPKRRNTPRSLPRFVAPKGRSPAMMKDNRRDSVAFNIGFTPEKSKTHKKLTKRVLGGKDKVVSKEQLAKKPQTRKLLGIRNFKETGI